MVVLVLVGNEVLGFVLVLVGLCIVPVLHLLLLLWMPIMLLLHLLLRRRRSRMMVFVIPRTTIRPGLDLGPIVDETTQEEPSQEEIGHLDHDGDGDMATARWRWRWRWRTTCAKLSVSAAML